METQSENPSVGLLGEFGRLVGDRELEEMEKIQSLVGGSGRNVITGR